MTDLRTRADARLRTAYELVRELDLLGRWSQYGDVEIVGSVGIGVVVAPDIDLEIHSDDPQVADGFAVMQPLAELPKSRRITYLDARDRHERGQYWKLEYELTSDETWTIDMWVMKHGASSGAPLTAAVRDALTPDLRDRVLAIKEEAVAIGERAYGYWLYQAVLDAGVRSFAEYRTWLGDRNIYERTGWMPG
ncbi:hypothetical protein E0H75_07460 [Kribbella capetownensis]|uniref:Uncharacterized protein n=1 Tax=Kribbella capetownensis TaxID=1572659 RepID=A0A4R0K432_9ACTN|nr:hypothetical protein [Kribbella capetownensis]TCC53514.1 hypothetical protein E0H75_07460 [Kribbella capetownensis]